MIFTEENQRLVMDFKQWERARVAQREMQKELVIKFGIFWQRLGLVLSQEEEKVTVMCPVQWGSFPEYQGVFLGEERGTFSALMLLPDFFVVPLLIAGMRTRFHQWVVEGEAKTFKALIPFPRSFVYHKKTGLPQLDQVRVHDLYNRLSNEVPQDPEDTLPCSIGEECP